MKTTLDTLLADTENYLLERRVGKIGGLKGLKPAKRNPAGPKAGGQPLKRTKEKRSKERNAMEYEARKSAFQASKEGKNKRGCGPGQKMVFGRCANVSEQYDDLLTMGGEELAEANIDQHAATELELYIPNTYSLQRQRNAIIQNQIKHMKKGRWNLDSAAKGFMYLVDAAAKAYNKEFGSGNTVKGFDKATRMYVATELAKEFKAEYDAGEFNESLDEAAESSESAVKGLYKAVLSQFKSDVVDSDIDEPDEYSDDWSASVQLQVAAPKGKSFGAGVIRAGGKRELTINIKIYPMGSGLRARVDVGLEHGDGVSLPMSGHRASAKKVAELVNRAVNSRLVKAESKLGEAAEGPFKTKEGKHGTLYLFAVEYTDPGDKGFPAMPPWKTWAYDEEHAIENFYDSEEGFEPVKLWKVRKSGGPKRGDIKRA